MPRPVLKLLAPIRPRIAVFALVLLFWSLALHYACLVPPLHGPDEPAHFDFAWRLAQEKTLPVMIATSLSEPVIEYALSDPFIKPFVGFRYSYEVYQPPLYYAALALTKTIEPANGVIPRLCYYWRMFSIMLVTPVIPISYVLVRVVIPRRQDWAIVVPAIAVLSPGFVYYNSVLTNSALETSLAVLILYVTVRWLRRGQLTYKEAIGLGGLLGVAVLAKVTAVLLVPAIVTAAFISRRHGQNWGRWSARLAIIAAVATALTGWWFLRNLWLYGDLFARSTFFVWADAPRFEFTPSAFRQLIREFLHDYWFGWVWLPRDSFIIAFIAVTVGLAVVGMVLRWWWFYIRGHGGWQKHLNLWPISIYSVPFALGIAWLRMTNALFGAGHARLIYPAGLGLTLLIMLGWEGLIGSHKARLLGILLVVTQGVEAIIRIQVYHQI